MLPEFDFKLMQCSSWTAVTREISVSPFQMFYDVTSSVRRVDLWASQRLKCRQQIFSFYFTVLILTLTWIRHWVHFGSIWVTYVFVWGGCLDVFCVCACALSVYMLHLLVKQLPASCPTLRNAFMCNIFVPDLHQASSHKVIEKTS